jgi:predicted house-cleaning NTP pyrophosphatase (Maf/HAM1 superfamily)
MISREKLEGYMHELALTYQEQGDNIWLVSGNQTGLENVVVMKADPVVVIQVKVMKAPQKRRAELFEQLLRFNATDMVHGAYALQGDDIVLIDSLEGESMDLSEFQASLDSFGVALSQHYQILAKYRS